MGGTGGVQANKIRTLRETTMRKTKIKTLNLLLVVLLTACSNVHHSFMDKAYVGYVDNKAVVLFEDSTRNGVKYYRPQFQSDCGRIYNKFYQDDNSSTGCLVRESRIEDLHYYKDHIGNVIPSKWDTIHDSFEGVNSTSITPDNL